MQEEQIFPHIADAIKRPQIIRVGENLYAVRFETMKIYSALAAVEGLLQKKIVKKGDTLLDSSSGVYALALALACNKYGMKCHIIASKAIDSALTIQLQILGVHVEHVAASATLALDQEFRVARIKEILAADPNVHWMQQYHDDIHYDGYTAVGRQIEEAIGTNDLTLIGGIGSGCSTGGIIGYLRRDRPDVRLVGLQPYGSVTFKCPHVEDPGIGTAGIGLAGMGSAIPFKNVRHELYDEVNWLSFMYGMSGAVDLLRRHGIFGGISSGGSYLIASKEAKRHPERNVVFIVADTGHRYVEQVFSKYRDALPISDLVPTKIDRVDDLVLPWSSMEWNRRPLA
jgi:cysteine synthase A